ncbi:MAG: hypothetical protein ACJ8AW_40630 [Rhodopila sp.]
MARPMDLYVSQGHKQAGVVLIGDAFQASCPATGMGIVRLLTDIERLCRVHVPAWFASPGMGADKITAFYDDPVKRACDAKALHDAEYRRSVSTETALSWRLHRARVRTMMRVLGLWNGAVAPFKSAHRRNRSGALAGDRIVLFGTKPPCTRMHRSRKRSATAVAHIVMARPSDKRLISRLFPRSVNSAPCEPDRDKPDHDEKRMASSALPSC